MPTKKQVLIPACILAVAAAGSKTAVTVTHTGHAELTAFRKAARPGAAAFIASVAPGAVAAQQQYGVPAAVTIAQAGVESAWGRSTLASQYHNLFGIKGTGPAGSVTMPTQEFQGGQWVTVQAQFRAYHDDAESIADHAALLATSGYYSRAMSDKGNPDQFASDLAGVYATDPGYGSTLTSVMRAYNLYAYDSSSAAAQPSQGVVVPSYTPRAVISAITYVLSQLGKPYLWGGTGPDGFDCSGLVYEGYLSAGISIPRTSQDQWAGLPHIDASQVMPGDMVFFAGGDGTPQAPGHVGLVIGKNRMIEAYAAGTQVRESSFGVPGSPAGDESVAGYARAVPWPTFQVPVQQPPRQSSPPVSSQPPAQAASGQPDPRTGQYGSGGDGHADGLAQVPGVITPVLAPSGSAPTRPASAQVPGASAPAPAPSQPGQANIPGIPG